MTIAILNPIDEGGLDLLATIVKYGIGRRHLEQRRLARSQSIGELVRHTVIDADTLRQFTDLAHTKVIGKPDRHHVA
jgi:hypothetical protein